MINVRDNRKIADVRLGNVVWGAVLHASKFTKGSKILFIGVAMAIWLQKRLIIWMGGSLLGGALAWNVGGSRAQNAEQEITRRKLTYAEAAKMFADGMNGMTQNSDGFYANLARILVSTSLKSKRQLGKVDLALIYKMVPQWKKSKQKINTKNQGRKATVETDARATTRVLVLIEENGSWGVDLIETYAKWNHLEGGAKAEAIYKITGVILEDLPHTESLNSSACQSNLKQIALGMAQYEMDYDEKLPPAEKWVDAISPYVKSKAVFNCPSILKGQRYGFAYNSKFAGKTSGLYSGKATRTVSVYETSVLKRNAYGTGENLAFRHQNGANYAFADGHVKWFPKTQIPSFKLKP